VIPYWNNYSYTILNQYGSTNTYHITTPDWATEGLLAFDVVLCRDKSYKEIEISVGLITYTEPPEGMALCKDCQRKLLEMVAMAFQPGSDDAKAYGCTCKYRECSLQDERHKKSCPLHIKPVLMDKTNRVEFHYGRVSPLWWLST
jgi:hypothetical protein